MKEWDPMDLELHHGELDNDSREAEVDKDDDGIKIELDF
jgi:hypothetical protein